MIPYIKVPDLVIGSNPVYLGGIRVLPITLHPFGILVATAVLVGINLSVRRARKLGYDVDLLNSFISWMLLFGFVLSHVLDEIFYHPEEVLKRPLSLLMVWEGLSSFGGFIGALVGIFAWKYLYWGERFRIGKMSFSFFRARPRPIPVLPFMDVIMAVFPTAWIFGRTGCSVVHDHPGARAPDGTFLAVLYPLPGERPPSVSLGPIELLWGGFPRWDLGFLELVFTIFVAACFALTWRKKLPVGMYLAVVSLAYAPVRFCMDFLRITDGEAADRRYGDLTFAQWMCIALFLTGLVLLRFVRKVERTGRDLAAPVRVAGASAPAGDTLPSSPVAAR